MLIYCPIDLKQQLKAAEPAGGWSSGESES